MRSTTLVGLFVKKLFSYVLSELSMCHDHCIVSYIYHVMSYMLFVINACICCRELIHTELELVTERIKLPALQQEADNLRENITKTRREEEELQRQYQKIQDFENLTVGLSLLVCTTLQNVDTKYWYAKLAFNI